MMERIRAAAQHFIFKIILGLIAISFVLSGGVYFAAGGQNYAAKVNGQEIPLQEFENIFQQELFYSKQEYTPEQTTELRKRIIDGLIDNILFDQYVTSLNLMLSDQEVIDQIRATPDFQENGVFDNNKYLSLITQQGFSAEAYGELVRRNLLSYKIREQLEKNIFVLPSEVDSRAKDYFQERTIRQAPIDLTPFIAKQSVTAEEIKAYYDVNHDKYTLPEEIKVEYLEFSKNTFMDQIVISDEEFKNYYLANIAKRNIAIIQLASKTEAEAVLAELKNGADFASIAKEKSNDIVTKNNGGELGMLSSSEIPPELKIDGFTEVGQISDVLELGDQFVIAKLIAIDNTIPATDSDIAKDIISNLKSERALDKFFEVQQKIGDAALETPDSLAKAKEVSGLTLSQTSLFSKDNIPEPFTNPQLIDRMFTPETIGAEGQQPQNSEVINLDGETAIIFRVIEHKPSNLQTMEVVNDQIVAVLKSEKALKEANAVIEKAITELNSTGESEAFKSLSANFGEAQVVSNKNIIEPELYKHVFSLPTLGAEGRASYTQFLDSKGSPVIVAFDKVTIPEISEQEKQQIKTALEMEKRNQLLQNLLIALKEKATIKYGEIGIENVASTNP